MVIVRVADLERRLARRLRLEIRVAALDSGKQICYCLNVSSLCDGARRLRRTLNARLLTFYILELVNPWRLVQNPALDFRLVCAIIASRRIPLNIVDGFIPGDGGGGFFFRLHRATLD